MSDIKRWVTDTLFPSGRLGDRAVMMIAPKGYSVYLASDYDSLTEDLYAERLQSSCLTRDLRAVQSERDGLQAQLQAMRVLLESVEQYAKDTLSGPSERPEDIQWHRQGWREIVLRIRAALAAPLPEAKS